MITLLKSAQREHAQSEHHQLWRTRGAEGEPALDTGEARVDIDEVWLPPGHGVAPAARRDLETVTYIYKGVLSQKCSSGSSAMLHAGEFQRLATGRQVRHEEINAVQADWTHVYRLALRSADVLLGNPAEQRHFTAAQRHNVLCAVASPDGREGSLRIRPDAHVYSCLCDSGRHLIHELRPGHSAWLHLVRGTARLNQLDLSQGDSVGFIDEPAVSLTVQASTEFLLVDLGPAPTGQGK